MFIEDYIESFFWSQLNSKFRFVCIIHHIVPHSLSICFLVAASLLERIKRLKLWVALNIVWDRLDEMLHNVIAGHDVPEINKFSNYRANLNRAQ